MIILILFKISINKRSYCLFSIRNLLFIMLHNNSYEGLYRALMQYFCIKATHFNINDIVGYAFVAFRDSGK